MTDLTLPLFVYEKIEWNLDDSFEEWLEKTEGWKFNPVYSDEKELMAVVMEKENEIHVMSDPKFRGKWLSRKLIKSIIGRIFDEYGKVITCTKYNDKDSLAFVMRLGFEPKFTQCELEEYKWQRKQ